MKVIDLDSTDDFAHYCQAIGTGFCPYLIPSMENQTLYAVEVDLSNIDEKNLSAYVYLWALQYTNIFKRMRAKYDKNENGFILLCINVIFNFPNTVAGKEKKYLSWAHWILKIKFSIDGIMFGKFWKNEETYSRNKRLIFPPKHNFISIRSTIVEKDIRLISPKQIKIIEDLKKSISNKNCNNYNIFDISSMSENEVLKVFEQAKKEASLFLT